MVFDPDRHLEEEECEFAKENLALFEKQAAEHRPVIEHVQAILSDAQAGLRALIEYEVEEPAREQLASTAGLVDKARTELGRLAWVEKLKRFSWE